MMWLVLGIVIGFAWHWLLAWSRAKGVRVSWLFWFLAIFTLIALLSGIQNYFAFLQEYEERAAFMTIPVYAVQVIIPALLAALVLWRSVKKARGNAAAKRAA